VCGYRSEEGGEYAWIYLGGGAILLAGFLAGAAGVLAEGAGPGHWSRVWAPWFPLVPWPESHHWLAFLVVGIGLTVGGLGITRRRRAAWAFTLILILYELALAARAAVSPEAAGGPPPRGAALFVLVASALLGALTARIGLALHRTPPRRARELQERARSAREARANAGRAEGSS
jgi:hypothetical protein